MKITRAQLKETLRTIMKEESEYQIFFKKALEKSGKSITDMSDEEKKDFFNKIDAAWDGKGEKNEGNAFGAAVTAAKEAGEDEFEVGGKTYKVEESVTEVANAKGYKPKNDFGARIIQAIDTNIRESNPKWLKSDGNTNEEILKYGTTFLMVVRNGIKAAFKFNYKVHPDVDFPMRKPSGRYFWFKSREDMEKYLKVFLADLKKLDSMIVSYLQKPTLKAQQEICNFWLLEVMVSSSRTGGFADGIMNSDTSKQSFYESVTEARGLNKSYVMYLAVDKKLKELEAAQKQMAQQYFAEKDEKKKAVLLDKLKKGTKVLQYTRKNLTDLETNYVMNLDKDAEYQGESVKEAIAVGKIVKVVDNPHWEAALGKKGPFKRKVKMIDGDNVFFTDGSNSSMKYVKESTETVNEGRAFINAAKKAKAEGKTEFEFNGKKYPVTIKD